MQTSNAVAYKREKQTLKTVDGSGGKLTNIEITVDNNIKSFDRVARKYSIDYSLKKTNPQSRQDTWFSSKQKMWMWMTKAFQEYALVYQ